MGSKASKPPSPSPTVERPDESHDEKAFHDVKHYIPLIETSEVTTIDLRSVVVGDEGASLLADSLKTNMSVVDVNLVHASMGPLGIKALASALMINSSIAVLGLSANIVGDDGAIALAETLKVNTSLTKLYLSAVNIGDEGSIALAEALKRTLISKFYYCHVITLKGQVSLLWMRL
ncbi:hypothetical protein GEMRC1_007713 [Eukaryota sp. GEM-RC1]